jgi:endonuclease YncB( thermonuclease family)
MKPDRPRGNTLIRHLPFALSLLAAQVAAEDGLAGRVVAIVDGNTLNLRDSANRPHRIRLLAIAAPQKLQPFGDHSMAALNALASGRDVVAECVKLDRNRQEVCKITMGGTDINLELVRGGMAWWYRQDVREQTPADQTEYQQAEFQAKIRRLGLWAEKNPVPPWQWHHPLEGFRP